MYFSPALIAVTASLLALGLAADPLSFTSWPKEPLEAGKPVTLTWAGGDSSKPYTLMLREGSSTQLKDVKAITDQGKDGTFTWTPDNDVKSGKTYAFQVKQGDDMNYTALLKTSDKPNADVPEEKEATTGATGTTTAPATQSTEASGTSTQATPATETTMTSTGSRALISSSANASGSPSSSAAASSTDSAKVTGTEVVNGKEASSTGSVQTGAASIPQYSVQVVMGVAGLLAYLV